MPALPKDTVILEIQGQEVLIDRGDLVGWPAPPGISNFGGIPYVYFQTKNGMVLLHRFIACPPAGLVVDHINGNTLDNRRENLRNCPVVVNAANRHRQSKPKSGFHGVRQRHARWEAYMSVADKFTSLGTFDTAAEAARARDTAMRARFGQHCILNFPDEVQL